jgi:hypothetical protein
MRARKQGVILTLRLVAALLAQDRARVLGVILSGASAASEVEGRRAKREEWD